MKRLAVGTEAPDFQAYSHEGSMVSLSELLKKGPVVLFFYPKDFTAGCTAQACTFREMHDEFNKLGSTIIGISADSNESHRQFAQKYKLPFYLVSDKEKTLHRKYQVGKHWGVMPERITFVVDTDGRIQYVFDSAFYVNKHCTNALEKIHQLIPNTL
ncbi:MAG: peroxiredoxin [Candidatus Latescibacterota bacterium]|nr:peroxiredoxin [Candidatus Latescibacterota bacterium]